MKTARRLYGVSFVSTYASIYAPLTYQLPIAWGKKRQNRGDKRNSIFKLCRRDLTAEIFPACKQFMSQTSQPFFINQSLTPLRSKIFYGLRQLKKKFPSVIKFCRSQSGNVLAFVKEAGSISTENPAGEAESTSIQSSSDGNETLSPQNPVRENLRRVVLNSKSDLEKFASETLGSNLDGIDISW